MSGLKFRVLLDNIKENKIFRDIIIDENANFEDFYNIIISAFSLKNDQMASFYVSNGKWDKGEEIVLMDMSFNEKDESTFAVMNELKIKERINSEKQHFILIHDFLSMWIFLIELHEIIPQYIGASQVVFKIGEIPHDFIQENSYLNQLQFDDEKFNINEFNDGNDYDDDFNDEISNFDD